MMLKEKEQLNQDLIKQKKQLADLYKFASRVDAPFATWVPDDVKYVHLLSS